MNYIEVNIQPEPLLPAREILLYELGEIGYESFEENEKGLLAYILSDQFSESALTEIAERYSDAFSMPFSFTEVEQRNWNAEWESGFQPIVVNAQCRIRAPFHSSDPDFEIELIIQPQMSFGTGHHETTWLMAGRMFELDLKDKQVLDMGCGTGVLAILAKKRGAGEVTAIDIDEWSYHNTLENIALNNSNPVIVEKGGASLLAGRSFHVILANINRNVLLADMPVYVQSLLPQGRILLSGFFVSDVDSIRTAAESLGLIFEGKAEKNNWVVLEFKKS